MHLAYIVVPTIIIAVVFTVVGAAPLAIPVLILGGLAVAASRNNRFYSRKHNPDVAGADNEPGPGIGYAHKGQAHMTPDSDKD